MRPLPLQRLGSWAVLGLLLAAALAGALTFDRRSWPGLVGDEATYLMQAQSLAWDFDVRYSRRDFDRFVAQWGLPPDGLILQSGDGGRTLVYAKPAAYALWIAPFLRLSPTRGVAIANTLLLAFAALLAARALERRLGPAAPLWVAVSMVASVTFAYVFWAHSDLFLMSLVAIALALAYGARRAGEDPETPLRTALRWTAAGLLLGLVFASRPFYGALLLPAALAVPAPQRRLGVAMLAAGALAAVLGSGLTHLAEADSWTPYSGERQSFDARTGFPAVNLPPESWRQRGIGRGNRSWLPSDVVGPRLTAWNSLYFLAGRDVGILPYFLPLLLGLAAFRRGEGRGMLILAALAASACFLVTRPFNFYGGGGALANRYFLPVYPAFWFAAGRRPARASWAFLLPVLAAACAAPFLLPLWRQPRAYLLDAENGYRYVSTAAVRLLPYETTQSHLKPGGVEDFMLGKLWIKPLATSVRAAGDGSRIRFETGQGTLLVGSTRRLPGLRLIADPPAPPKIDVHGAGVRASHLRPDGGSVILLALRSPRAVHRMWWSEDENPLYIYEIRLDSPAPFAFQLQPLAGPPGERK
jgi:hypothetical protein